MQFIKVDSLKPGMRLARPIFDKKGVLLYDRGKAIKDEQAIQNIQSFGLIGLFILEAAEPVPPMTEKDREFERFQTVMSAQIKEELDTIRRTKKSKLCDQISAQIISRYGNTPAKINFFQSLRSKEDYIYKHSLNTAILCAAMAHRMNLPLGMQRYAVMAALVHDIGKLAVPPELMYKSTHTPEEEEQIHSLERQGYALLNETFISDPQIARICKNAERNLRLMEKKEPPITERMQASTKVLMVAGVFDKCTAGRFTESPMAEISVIRKMMEKPAYYDPTVVRGLMNSITLLTPGESVELTNGMKALVISQNEDLLRPTVLTFDSNRIVNLSNLADSGGLEVKDIMKTMDNRHVMNHEMLGKMGIQVEEE
ncbi:MAG: HD domain-containing protein [Lachnospiraceae bacterium]|nr:HD domain-containing protein [Lachnospiraceae bacterium]